MGSFKWGYKSPNMGYNYSYPKGSIGFYRFRVVGSGVPSYGL